MRFIDPVKVYWTSDYILGSGIYLINRLQLYMYIICFSRNVTILCIITDILKCYWCCFVLMYCYLLVALVLQNVAMKLLHFFFFFGVLLSQICQEFGNEKLRNILYCGTLYQVLCSVKFMWWSTCKLLKEICWILNAFKQCLSTLMCWVQIPLKVRCTWYNIMW